SRTGFGGELGYELFLTDPADATELWNAVVGAGVTPFGVEAIEILRIEAGLIVTDYDYEAHQRSPYDFNLDRLVALDRDLEFAGTEKLRAVAADPPNRFVTLKIEGDTLPEYGAEVTKDGEPIGVLTSPTDSPRFGRIGLAVLRSGHASTGTTVEVKVGEGTTPAIVDALPIYDTNKQRPRA
ncbi:MAG: glycine cleavage T C-terminal barrel domain-containing protein, partial [Actinomycetota bacterium]